MLNWSEVYTVLHGDVSSVLDSCSKYDEVPVSAEITKTELKLR